MKHKLLLLLAMIIGLASNVWADGFSGSGTGTSADPYQITSAAQLVEFANYVNEKADNVSACAVLKNNITLSSAWTTPIGNNTRQYTGTFDGGNYTISNFSFTTSRDTTGFFGRIGNGAVIKNFTIEGTISSTHGFVGVIGTSWGNATISNIHSKVNITCTKSRHAGILGYQGGTGTINIDRCTYSGKLTVTNGVTGNFGGIVGLTQNSANAKVNITNCLFDGEIDDGSGSNAGGIVGYSNKTAVTIKNCLSIGTITAKNSGQFIGQLNASNSKWAGNNYYKTGFVIGVPGSGVTMSGTEPATKDSVKLASGEVCFLLNESTQGGTNWYQTLNGTNYPTPYGTDKVYDHNSFYCDMTPIGDVSYTNTPSIGAHATYTDGFCDRCRALQEDYITATAGYYEIGSKEQLVWFAAFVKAGNYNVNAKLTIDIDMDEADISYFPIGTQAHPYTGTFDGQGNKISNLQLINASAPKSYGMFNTGAGVVLKDFWLDSNCAIQGTEEVGLIGRHAGSGGSFEGLGNCGNVTGSSQRVGGLIGAAWGGDNPMIIRNCWTKGNVSGTTSAGAICGWFNNITVNIENCWTKTEVTGATNNNKYMYDNGNGASITVTNCYSKNGSQSTFSNTISDGQLTSGELCYLLNGSTSGGTNWYQTLGTDGNPYPYTTHGVVYRNGVFCPDTGEPQGTFSYGNDDEGSIGSHNYVDGICSYCNFVKSDYMTPVDGYYMIGTPAQLKWFAAYVNAGHPAVNAKLTNITPIDLTGITMQPIGNASVQYTGTFDGQGRSITNFTTEPCRYNGLFGYINGATVKNFTISGTNAGIETLTTGDTNCIGVIGQSVSTSKISGIHSSLNITVRCASDAGGILGSGGSASGTDKLTISNCSYSGTLTVNDGVATDQFGGIVGYTAAATIKNCLFAGIVNGSASGRGFGGILGYTNYYIKGIQNCLSVGTISGTGGRYGHIIGNYPSTNDLTSVVFNNYYPSGAVAGAGNHADKVGTIAKSVEELASGEVCYLLNGNQSEINWYQTIGTDDYPTLDSSSEQVRFVGTAGYTTFYDEDNDWELLGDAKAYIGTINGSALHLDEIGDIPHDKAVVIGGTYYNRVSTTATADTDGNALLGSKGTIEGDGVNIYALAKKNDVVGFYPVADGVTIPAGKAYLNLSGSLVREFFTFVFDDDDATGINSPLLTSPEEEGQVYNLAGQRISKLQKGINIINGKKVLK